MMDFVATFQHWLTLACFVALAVCLFALAVLRAIPELTDAIRRFCGMDNFSKVVCGVCIVGAVLYGGSKGVNVRWDDGLRDNGTLITNDTVAVRWTYSGIPGASSVFIDYREAGTTNDWLNLAETLASAQEWTGTLANAMNYDYWVYSTYVPPVPVHTNGVWVGQAYETKAKVGAAAFLILNGKVVADGRTIAPPKWAEPLPYDAEVEYLASTGTQYIDTGYRMTSDDMRFECHLMRTANGGAANFFYGYRFVQTAEYRGDMRAFFIYGASPSGRIAIRYGANTDNSTATIPINTRVRVAFDGSKVSVDGVEYATLTGASSSPTYGSMSIFDCNTGSYYRGDVTRFIGRIYGFAIWQDGVLVRDFIPVRVGTTGALYDRRGVGGMNPDGSPRNDGMYYNRGTGNFGYGNDK